MCDGTATTTYGSTSNGGSSNGKATNGDIEKAPLLISRENTPDSTDGNENGNGNKGNTTTKHILIGVAILVVILIGSSIIHSRDDKNDNSRPNGISWDNDVFNDDDRDEHSDNTDPSSSSSDSSSSSNPFLLDPIHDMGMLSVQRNMDASPSIVWGKHLHKKNHPLPTNSWYLVSY